MSTTLLKALHSKLDIKRHSPSVLFNSEWKELNSELTSLFDAQADLGFHLVNMLFL